MLKILKALAEENRLRIVSILVSDDMCVCEIENCLNLTQSNVSRHLSVLLKSGVLTSYKKAQWVYYKINSEFIESNMHLWQYLEEEMKKIPSYKDDYNRIQICKLEDVCGTFSLKNESKKG